MVGVGQKAPLEKQTFFFLFCKGFIFGSEQEGLKSAGINVIKNTEHFSLFLFLFVFSSLLGYSQALEN